MHPLAWDTETALIRPGCLAPPLVCLTWQRPGQAARICTADEAHGRLRDWLADPSTLFVGANVAYDFAVVAEAFPDLIPAIWDAYAADRVTDVQTRQRLLDIAGGCYLGRYGKGGVYIKHEYSLEALAKRVAGMELSKDAWRLRYADFAGAPLKAWSEIARASQARAREEIAELRATWSHVRPSDVPKEVTKTIAGLESMIASDAARCVEYPLDDARATLAVWQKQEEHAAYLADQYRQARAAWWLHLGSAWGLRTDAHGVEVLRRETEAEVADLTEYLVDAGLVRPDGSRDTKAAKARMVAVCREIGRRIPRTDGHAAGGGKCRAADGAELPDGDDACVEHVCLDAEACSAVDDETLKAYAELSTAKKVLGNDVEALARGIAYPIHTRYGLAETGRTTSSKPNIQNVSKRPGLRETYIPREGRVFAQCDYPTLELYTLAQCCIAWVGFSKLSEALNGGLDPHLWFAAKLLGISYEVAHANSKRDDVKKARQLAKAANFGFPGGMGAPKLVATTRRAMSREAFAALGLDEARARRLKDEWLGAWPEMRPYFARVSVLHDSGALIETLRTQRFRGGATYCASCNTGFQALAADIGKEAGWRLSRGQYVDRASPLFGSRTVAFVHDEFILEADAARGHEVATALADVMAEGANVYLTDVPMPRAKLEPLLMVRWSKNAEPRFDNGRLIPWTKQ